MNAALKISGLSAKKDVVEEALKLLVQVKNQSRLKKLRGKLKWEGNLDEYYNEPQILDNNLKWKTLKFI